MNNNGSLTQKKPKQGDFLLAIRTDTYQNLIKNTLRDPIRANNFIANISSVVTNNPALRQCRPDSILTAAFLAESLGLSLSPSLGRCYLIPFKVAMRDESGKKIPVYDAQGKIQRDKYGNYLYETESVAQFVLGYKGYQQLAIRSGSYRRIIVTEVKEGEIKKPFDRLTEEITLDFIEDELLRDQTSTVGYYAAYQCTEALGGFVKGIYWSKAKMMNHADKYSPAFSASAYMKIEKNEIPKSEQWKYSSFWYKDFDMMAKKTMIRQLFNQCSDMSYDMGRAYERDNSIILKNDEYRKIDTDTDFPILPEPDDTLDPIPEQEQNPPQPQQKGKKIDLNAL